MASTGLAPLKEIWAMLDRCAPDWKCKETDHFFWLMWNGRTYPSFPKKREVAIGHIRKMIRHLGIDLECAKNHLKVLH